MPNIEVGRVINMNNLIQCHLDQGGTIELVIQSDGKHTLDIIPTEAQIVEMSNTLEGK